MELVSSGQNSRKFVGFSLKMSLKKIAELARSFSDYLARSRDLERVIGKLRQIERGQQSSAIHMRISTHAAITGRRKFRQFRR